MTRQLLALHEVVGVRARVEGDRVARGCPHYERVLGLGLSTA